MKYTLIYPSDQWKLAVEENMDAKLSFSEPGSGGSYDEITWYKERTSSSKYRIVFLHPSATEGQPRYFNDYCSASSPCDSSSKGTLNSITGTFTASTGRKYEIELEVYGEYMINTTFFY